VEGVSAGAMRNKLLVRQHLKRPCSRQNLEQHCHSGLLPKSTVSLAPIRLDSELVVAEFVANTNPRRSPCAGKGDRLPSRAAVMRKGSQCSRRRNP
jgi:hypothetical protein